MQGNQIRWIQFTLLQDKVCPEHARDGTAKCCGCGRLCPRPEAWPEVEPGRHICLACLDSVVVDTQDAQPLYSKVSCPCSAYTNGAQSSSSAGSWTVLAVMRI